ncbi:uncharacterized protein L969DRAFT_96179 [Mixia osmundae IAM 14324]|uniref:Mitochondrial import inner membrane translocase subunit n=1 Tax=Mixia osmundae (strain CBS 9802 / IAM 14324 / JCM 22182 / KY 12970) TaxID=764103 RepID=G7E4S7_MIXOS|nr:uncharacterized protein L969DRAFT_96179 [Mixia osmundae IAM 14324]KEI37657.1 hypothetical protein L969DRAFT_96179 [Mixia osmundae IAM 14324]GAA97837.1 hypothetical protein E5Q_04516 [Mixia osmundae IAM 14324]
MDGSNYTPQEQQMLEATIAKRQMHDFFKLYSGLVERCFNTCCNDFTTKAVTSKEDECIKNCSDKFLAHSNRVGLRFAEHNAEMMQKQQQQ